MTIKGMVFDEKKAAGERLMLACKEMPNADMMLLGTYRGFELTVSNPHKLLHGPYMLRYSPDQDQ